MEAIMARIHDAGCPLAAIYTAKGEKQAQDEAFGFDNGEIGPSMIVVKKVDRAFKSKAPAVRIATHNHNISDRKTGKMPVILATCSEFGTSDPGCINIYDYLTDNSAIMIDTRKFIIIAQYSGEKSDKEKREIMEKLEQVGADIMSKKL